MTLQVSVVVPTCKRPDLLERCLSALLAQDFPPPAYEVIIVDDAACPETRQQVECCAHSARKSGHTVRYIAMSSACCTHGPAAARNKGWQAAKAAIIAFTDDDCVPTPDWLKTAIGAFKDDVVGISGRIIVPLTHRPTDYEYNAAHLEQSEFVTANCFYRRATLAQVGGFDERFTAPWREDSDLFFSLLERGASCIHVPQAVVIHPIRPASWGVSIRQQRKSMFNALLYKKHPVLYRQKVQATPPLHYYGIVATLLLACVGILRRSPFLALSGIGLWSWLTGRFCLRRLRNTSHAPEHVAEMIVTSAIIPPLAIFWRLRGMLKFRVFFL